MTRRDLLFAAAVTPLCASAHSSKLAMEAYIFQQYAKRQHKPLGDVLAEVLSMAKNAGYRNIELNAEFFAPPLKNQTLDLLRANRLDMPSVYSGGPMHAPQLADGTIDRALSIAKLCQPFGCTAVVCNADPKGQGIEKTDAELAVQAEQLNRMGRVLSAGGFELRIHNHTPEMLSGAREWRRMLHETDPKLVSFCVDLDWVHQGGQDPLALLKEAGSRVHEIHVRNSKDKLWLEDFAPGDVDYAEIASYLESARLTPLIVVELAYRDKTIVTRPLETDLRLSRLYAQKTFKNVLSTEP